MHLPAIHEQLCKTMIAKSKILAQMLAAINKIQDTMNLVANANEQLWRESQNKHFQLTNANQLQELQNKLNFLKQQQIQYEYMLEDKMYKKENLCKNQKSYRNSIHIEIPQTTENSKYQQSNENIENENISILYIKHSQRDNQLSIQLQQIQKQNNTKQQQLKNLNNQYRIHKQEQIQKQQQYVTINQQKECKKQNIKILQNKLVKVTEQYNQQMKKNNKYKKTRIIQSQGNQNNCKALQQKIKNLTKVHIKLKDCVNLSIANKQKLIKNYGRLKNSNQ